MRAPKPDYVSPVRAARLVVDDYIGSFAFYYSDVALPIHDLNMKLQLSYKLFFVLFLLHMPFHLTHKSRISNFRDIKPSTAETFKSMCLK
jgi:hypothetical protein